MKSWMTRADAEIFAEHFQTVDIKLDDPQWDDRFEDLIDLWNKARGDDVAPNRRAIDLIEIPKLLPAIQVYELVGDPGELKVEVIFQGADLALYTRKETGLLDFSNDYRTEHHQKIMFDYIKFLLAWPKPFWVDGALTVWRRGHYLREKYVSLPLSSNGTEIDGAVTASILYGKP